MFDAQGYEIDTAEAFREFLDELHESVTIAGIEFPASEILEECDPVAFECELSNYESQMESDGEWFEEDPTEDEED